MISRPTLRDFSIIGFSTGKILTGVSLLYVVPLAIAAAFGEWSAFVDFAIGLNATLAAGAVLILLGDGTREPTRWIQSMVIAAFSWFAAMLLCAIPHFLSGNFLSYLDCIFDVMSGFTTTGLTLIQDLDHASHSLNMWRHLLTYVGGQGMIVMVLVFLLRGTAGAYMMYVGEGKDERLLPNIVHTSRAIWLISIVYLIIGTAVLSLLLAREGIGFPRCLLHGLWLFQSAWSTGGFAPQSQNVLYYHSYAVELGTLFFFVIGSFNFILHYAVWSGNVREMWKNIEIRSFTVTAALTTALLVFALAQLSIYGDAFILFRRAVYNLLSAHTTTGFATAYVQQFKADWGDLALLAMITAMAFGGSACSTAGGIKGLRVGIIAKSIYHEIKRIVLSEDAVFVTKFHHIRDIILGDQQVKMAGLIALCYVVLYFTGGILGVVCGYPFTDALFESTSAGSNSGLSCGITAAGMPLILKLYYLLAMWAGRLEFISLFGLIAFGVSVFRGK